MSAFMDRARAEAESRWSVIARARTETEGRWSVIALGREQATRCRNAFADGAQWASEQEPTDEEVEAADAAFHEVIMSGEWVSQEQAIRAALLAAQKVRAGQ